MIFKKIFVHVPTKKIFEIARKNDVADKDAIAFIDKPRMIWALGKYFPCPYTKKELQAIFDAIDDRNTLDELNLKKLIDSLPHTVVTEIELATADEDSVDFKVKSVTKGDGEYGLEVTEKTITIPAATATAAGLMSAADKKKFDYIKTVNFEYTAPTEDGSTVTLHSKRTTFATGAEDTSNIAQIPAATSTTAGVMSATDKTELDRIETANFKFTSPTEDGISVTIHATKTTISTGASVEDTTLIPAATESVAGVMSAADKTLLDRLGWVEIPASNG